MPTSVDSLNDALAGRYTVERELGEGGMATVYLAKDLRHQRNVALKVMKSDLAAGVGAERFLAEIRTTANLQHPHILPLHDSGDLNGVVFYTMPYVEGETLRQRMDRDGRLPVKEALGIAADVADALQAAHEHGVVHRDIKPSNILLSRGKALVVDFGIARAADHEGGTRLTQTGSALGTVGYMSPEQCGGQAEVDHRADIYGLGCVLFEMLAGETPYRGRTFLEVLRRQATEPVPSIRGLRQDVPITVDRALTTSLAQEPEGRFESATAFAEALSTTWLESAKPAGVDKKILVLPFVNRSADPDNEYFSDGLTDEVISDLSRISALRVISRNSSMTLKGTTKDTPTLAKELGVSHLVTGTVRRAGSALRITADLVEAMTDTPIWSEKFSGTMDDVFGIQEEISRRIVAALKVRLTTAEDRGVAERLIDDPVAYDCYLRAKEVMNSWTSENQHRAMRLIDDAIEILGDSPLLLAMKANIHWSQVNIHVAPAEEGLARASALVDQALAIDPSQPLAIHVRGCVAGMRAQPEAALVDLYRAHKLLPSDSNILDELIRYSMFTGLATTRKYVDKAVEIDPLGVFTTLHLAFYPFIYGPRSEAAAPARRFLRLVPDDSSMRVYASWPLAHAGFREEAMEVLDAVGKTITDNMHGPFGLFLSHALKGEEDAALRVMTPDLESEVENDIACRMMADGYALLGRTQDAIRWVRTAIERGFINYPNLDEQDVFLDSVRGEPEFQALMAELRPRWEALVEWERDVLE